MIKYGESLIDQIYYGQQMINKVYYGKSLIFSKEEDIIDTPGFIYGTNLGKADVILTINGEEITVPTINNKFEYQIDLSKDIISLEGLFGYKSTIADLHFTKLYVNNIPTDKVTTIRGAFYRSVRYIETLDLSAWNTSKVENMEMLFADNGNLKRLLLDNFDCSNVTAMNNMFDYTPDLNYIRCKQAFKDWCWKNQDTINLPEQMREGGDGVWDIIDAEDQEPEDNNDYWISGTANGDAVVLKINESEYSVPVVDGKFYYTPDFEVTSLRELCNYQNNITALNLKNVKIDNVTDIGCAFALTSVKQLDLSHWNTQHVQIFDLLFAQNSVLTTLYLDNFDMSNWQDRVGMLDCDSLNYIRCKQAFKDWCIENQDEICLPEQMREGGSGTWDIVE